MPIIDEYSLVPLKFVGGQISWSWLVE